MKIRLKLGVYLQLYVWKEGTVLGFVCLLNVYTDLICLERFRHVSTNHIPSAFCPAGLGKTTPDPSASITMDGVEVPLGTGISSGVNDTCLLYNEYPFTSVLCTPQAMVWGCEVTYMQPVHPGAGWLKTVLWCVSRGTVPLSGLPGQDERPSPRPGRVCGVWP